jgi:hypothetical protein
MEGTDPLTPAVQGETAARFLPWKSWITHEKEMRAESLACQRFREITHPYSKSAGPRILVRALKRDDSKLRVIGVETAHTPAALA